MRTLKTKTSKGPGESKDEPMLIPKDEEGTLTQEPVMVESDPRLGTCIREMRSWDDIYRRLTY